MLVLLERNDLRENVTRLNREEKNDLRETATGSQELPSRSYRPRERHSVESSKRHSVESSECSS